MRSLLLLAPASLAMLGGCSRETASANDVDIANAADAARGSVDKYAALPQPTKRRINTAPKAIVPVSAASPAAEQADPGADDSAPAAAAVVTRYYALLEAGRYAEAWQFWDRDGAASDMTQQAFTASFAKFATYRTEVGAPGRIDAGAGQRYVTVPVRVSGRLKDGDRPFAMEGPITLHRVADIDGATPAQRRWRISTSGVRPRPETASSAPPTTPPAAATTGAKRR